MPLSGLDLRLAPIPRSREENQQRAFIAASRRKDRSLASRLESASRASLLYKSRTGKAFYITKEIVEKDGMYAEINERYQAKRILMLQTRNFQIKEGFYHHLLTGFPNRPILHSNGPSIASRRASKLTFRASFSGNPQKMRLDLSNISSTLSHGSAALASATATSDAHVTSPNTPFDPNARSDITCTDSVEDPFTMLAPPPAITSGQIRSYSMQQTSAPAWNTAAMQHQQTPASNQTLTDTYSVQVWQQQMMRQAGAPAIQLLQSRGCLASALKFSLHHPASPQYDLSGSVSYPTTDCHNHGHPWGHEFPILTRADQLAQMPPTATVGSPKSQAMSAESELISGSGPTHDAPLPFITASVAQAEISPTIKGEGEGIAVNLEDLHMGSNQFSQFGL